MRLLIVSKEKNIESYVEFVEALDLLGVEAICVPDVEYCSLGKLKPLHVIPLPKLLKLVKRFNPDFVLTDSPYPVPHIWQSSSTSVYCTICAAVGTRLTGKVLCAHPFL